MVNSTRITNLKPTDLPAPPHEAIGIVRACTNPNITSKNLGEIITHNAVLTAELLRIVNSAYFGLRTRVTSAAHAVTLLGHRALRNLALCVAIRDAMRPDAIPLLDMGAYLEQALRRAVAARSLSRYARQNPEECFTIGLLQDFGLLVMMYVDQDRAADWAQLASSNPEKRYELEMGLFGTTHDRVGETLAEAWALPSELRQVMGLHHAPAMDTADKRLTSLCTIARCADWMAAVFTAADKRFVIQRCEKMLGDDFGLGTDTVGVLLDEVSNAVIDAGTAMGIRVGKQSPLADVLREANLRLAEDNLSYQELTLRLEQTLLQRDRYAGELNRELELAREVQRSLMPRPPRECHGFQGINTSARELSGDFYDYFPSRGGDILFCIADVSGKGMNAAMLMAKVSSLFRCLGKAVTDPAALLSMLNREVAETTIRGMFVTMIGGRYNAQSGQVQLANAGHLPALYHPVRGPIVEFGADAPPLGILPDADFVSREFVLGDGALYLYTDGIIEARQRDTGELGISGLKKLIHQFRDVPTDRRARKLFDAVRDSEVRDDVTVLVIDPRKDSRNRKDLE
jgi:sigma-B regulation protein RsbU (phosphoserine phosphatase)